MKKILFLHGFSSSGSCEIAETLNSEFENDAEIVSPDLPLHPFEAMDLLQDICKKQHFNLIIGSSCGSFYGQQLVGITGIAAILVSPFLKMTEFLQPRLGIHEYKAPRLDGNQQFEISPELIAEFSEMENHQFDHYDEDNRSRVWGMFGTQDTLAHFKRLFLKYYDTAIDYNGPHTMTADNVIHDLAPAIRRMFNKMGKGINGTSDCSYSLT